MGRKKSGKRWDAAKPGGDRYRYVELRFKDSMENAVSLAECWPVDSRRRGHGARQRRRCVNRKLASATKGGAKVSRGEVTFGTPTATCQRTRSSPATPEAVGTHAMTCTWKRRQVAQAVHSVACTVVLALAVCGCASADTLLHTCSSAPTRMCVRVDDSTFTFYPANRSSSYGADFYTTTLSLEKVVMGDENRPPIYVWADCVVVPDERGKNTTVNVPSFGGGEDVTYNQTQFRCRAVVRVPPAELDVGLGAPGALVSAVVPQRAGSQIWLPLCVP